MKRTLIVRAECFIDFTRFLHCVFYANEAKWISNVPSINIEANILKLSVENDELDINYFRNMAANVIDGHVMVQTMQLLDEDKENEFGGQRNFDIPKFKPTKLTFDCQLSDGSK